MRIFEVNDEIESYTYPVTKILICIIIDVIAFNRDKIIPVSNEIVDMVIRILSLILVFGGFSCILSSLFEIWNLHSRRAEAKQDGLGVENTEEDDKLYVKKGMILFALGLILAVSVFVLILCGTFGGNDDRIVVIFLISALVCGIFSVILIVKSLPAVFLYESMKIDKKYDKEKLYELSFMQRENVKTRLLAEGFELKDGYYRKKKFSFLKDFITYYFRMVDCIDIQNTIDSELDRFDKLEKKKKNNCLCLLVYLDRMDENDRTIIKELGKTGIYIDETVGAYADITYVVAAVDKETNIGYFLDIGKRYGIALYSYCCRMIKKVFE